MPVEAVRMQVDSFKRALGGVIAASMPGRQLA